MKRIIAVLLVGVMVLSMAACGKKDKGAEVSEEAQTGVANPWTDTTEEAAFKEVPFLFTAPEGAENVSWRRMENGDYPMIELDFTLGMYDFCARAQYGAAEDEDISGMYYDWSTTESVTLANWGGGRMTGTIRTGTDGEAAAFLCSWYDIEMGEAYTLSTTTQDDTELDIQAVAESMYDETKYPGYNAPDNDVQDETAATEAEEPVAETETDNDAIIAAAGDYMISTYASQYEKADVSIPYIEIVDIDASDENDIKVWGDFWIDNYDIEGDTLMTQSGGSYPGCMHIAKLTSGDSGTSMDVVEDGSRDTDSAKEIFGDRYEAFSRLHDDGDARNQNRTDQIAAYVKNHGIHVTKYQDYGWDAVAIQ